MTLPALEALARELAHAHHTSPYWPYVLPWVEHWTRMIARGVLHQLLGWGDPRRRGGG